MVAEVIYQGKNGRETVEKYSIRFKCDECGQIHPMGHDILLENGPASKTTIGDFFAGREIDSQVVKIIRNKTLCPRTGNLTSQQDVRQIFLAPLDD